MTEVSPSKSLTIRDLPERVAKALERERRRRGQSLNQTVIDLLDQSLGVKDAHSNGLGRLAGRWSKEEFREFEQAVAPFERVDEEPWQ